MIRLKSIFLLSRRVYDLDNYMLIVERNIVPVALSKGNRHISTSVKIAMKNAMVIKLKNIINKLEEYDWNINEFNGEEN